MSTGFEARAGNVILTPGGLHARGLQAGAVRAAVLDRLQEHLHLHDRRHADEPRVHHPRRLRAVAPAALRAAVLEPDGRLHHVVQRRPDPVLPEHARPGPAGQLFRHHHRLRRQRLQHHPSAQLLRGHSAERSRRPRGWTAPTSFRCCGRSTCRCPSPPSPRSRCSASCRAGTASSGRWCCCRTKTRSRCRSTCARSSSSCRTTRNSPPRLLTAAYSFETVSAAIIVCSIIPILLIYPFLQKYFSKGILLGGVKE